jgi:hypothetical protein
LISVCVPTFNGAPYIAAQLASILRSPRVSEVLVSDDGSTDGTLDVLRAIGDARVQVIDGPRRGLIRNYEALLARARGEFVFLADQDDVWLPEKVETMVAHLENADLVVSDCTVTDVDLAVVNPSFFALRRSGPGLLRNLLRNSYLGCCMAMRRDLLRHALPFPERLPMHDWWLGLVGETFGRVAFIPENSCSTAATAPTCRPPPALRKPRGWYGSDGALRWSPRWSVGASASVEGMASNEDQRRHRHVQRRRHPGRLPALRRVTDSSGHRALGHRRRLDRWLTGHRRSPPQADSPASSASPTAASTTR